jgi:hypothetical protein
MACIMAATRFPEQLVAVEPVALVYAGDLAPALPDGVGVGEQGDALGPELGDDPLVHALVVPEEALVLQGEALCVIPDYNYVYVLLGALVFGGVDAGEQLEGADVGVGVPLDPEVDQHLPGDAVGGVVVAHRPEEHGFGLVAGLLGLVGEGVARLDVRFAPHVAVEEVEAQPGGLQDLDGLVGDLRAYTVPWHDGYLVLSWHSLLPTLVRVSVFKWVYGYQMATYRNRLIQS